MQVAKDRIRLKHLSRFTEKHYLDWIRRFIRFHKGRHPRDMAESDIESFLSYLAVGQNVSPATQNQVLNAIVIV